MKPRRIEPPCPTNNIVDLSAALPEPSRMCCVEKHAEDVPETEWALYQKSLAVVHEGLDRIRARPFDPVTIDELVKLISSRLSLAAVRVVNLAHGSVRERDEATTFFGHVARSAQAVSGRRQLTDQGTSVPSPAKRMNKATLWLGIATLFLASCAELASSLPGYNSVLVSEYPWAPKEGGRRSSESHPERHGGGFDYFYD